MLVLLPTLKHKVQWQALHISPRLHVNKTDNIRCIHRESC